MAAGYNRHLIILIAVVLLVVAVVSNYTTPVLGHRVRYIHSSLNSTTTTTTTTQKEKQDHLIDHEEKHDQLVRRSIALAALDPDDPAKFLYFVRKYYETTYFIHPETKKLVSVLLYVNPRMNALLRCRRCRRPAPITEADWKRYEAAVKIPPRRSWITSLDVSRCRLWLEANPPPL